MLATIGINWPLHGSLDSVRKFSICNSQSCCSTTHPSTSLTLPSPVNPLSPNIHIQILQTDLYTFP